MIAPLGRALAPARRSLVRRLVGLAAIWSLAVLAAGGLALTIFFAQSSTARFDDDLSVTVDGLLAGTSDEGGRITAPISDDPRTSRTYSGEYWEIATPTGAGLRAEARAHRKRKNNRLY